MLIHGLFPPTVPNNQGGSPDKNLSLLSSLSKSSGVICSTIAEILLFKREGDVDAGTEPRTPQKCMFITLPLFY
jgi:hypothetical protein